MHLNSYVLLNIYKNECERMRRFILEANVSRACLEAISKALRPILAVAEFRTLLKSEGFATMPRTLAERTLGDHTNAPHAEDDTNEAVVISQELVRGISLDVLDLLQDCIVSPKIFGLLRQVVPRRQLEIVQIMIGLAKVKVQFAKTLIALTPHSQLANPLAPRNQFARITADRLAAMETELAVVSDVFRNAVAHFGRWGIELVAAQGYLNQLMNNPKILRYLAHEFPDQLQEFNRVVGLGGDARFLGPLTRLHHNREVTNRPLSSGRGPELSAWPALKTP